MQKSNQGYRYQGHHASLQEGGTVSPLSSSSVEKKLMDELLELDRQKKELSDSQTQIKQELVGMGYTKEAISIVKKLMEMEGALRNEVDNDTENLRVKCGVPKQHSLGLV